jgi:alkylhydroperoxidase/carboxymuconolactone decarboxylase family protein YurZ
LPEAPEAAVSPAREPPAPFEEVQEMNELGNKEKALIALSAAMAAGCQTCAMKLYPLGLEAGATPEEIERALYVGLCARESATTIMRRRAEALLERPIRLSGVGGEGEAGQFRDLIKLAAAAAADSPQEAARWLHSAKFLGATEGTIEVALAIARKVRSKASAYSDAEVDEIARERTPPAAAAGHSGGGGAPRRDRSCCV